MSLLPVFPQRMLLMRVTLVLLFPYQAAPFGELLSEKVQLVKVGSLLKPLQTPPRDDAELPANRQSVKVGLARLVMGAEQDTSALNDEERLLFYEFTTWRMATWELTYLEYIDGLIDEELWLAWDGYYMLFVEGKPGYRTFFIDTRQQWDSRFMAHVDKSLQLSN